MKRIYDFHNSPPAIGCTIFMADLIDDYPDWDAWHAAGEPYGWFACDPGETPPAHADERYTRVYCSDREEAVPA